jgi:hypothetical protein
MKGMKVAFNAPIHGLVFALAHDMLGLEGHVAMLHIA